MEYKKTTTIKFNSNFKLSGTNNNATYYIDWSAILDDNKKYMLTWTNKRIYKLNQISIY